MTGRDFGVGGRTALIAGMAEALQVIHGAGIVHRDLKPSNVLLAADGPRVIDFGIAYAADATSLTGSGVAVGTPSFMAPEQAAGNRVTAATDVFALGQVAAYAATGTPAFGEGTGHGVLYRIVHEQPDLSAVPERLTELVTRCLAKDPDARPSVAEVISLCQSANAETVLRRPEDWLPAPVSADITSRIAAPAPVQTPPPPATAPSVGYAPTAPASAASAPPDGYAPTAPAAPAAPPGYPPASPTSPAAAPATAPPGYGPAAAHPSPHPYPTPVPAYAPAPLPAHGQTYPGHPVHPGFQPQPQPARKRGAPVALVAALVFAVAGAGTAYVVLKGKNGQEQGADSPQANDKSGGGRTSSSAKPGGAAKSEPKPADFKAINLTAGYHLTLGDDDVRPQKGEDGGYELSYDTGGYLDAESQGGNLVLLDPGQEGSLAACRVETRFTETVYVNKLAKGRQVCITTGSGHLGLLTVQGFSAEESPSTYMTVDVTVWRNAVGSASGG